MDLEHELKEFEKRQTARQSLPLWLRFLMPTLFLFNAFAAAFLFFLLLSLLRLAIRPDLGPLIDPAKTATSLSAALTFALLTAVFFAGVSSSIFVSNLILGSIPAALRTLERSSAENATPNYRAAMATGRKALIYATLPCLVIAALIACFSRL
jgi:hypothetical protein